MARHLVTRNRPVSESAEEIEIREKGAALVVREMKRAMGVAAALGVPKAKQFEVAERLTDRITEASWTFRAPEPMRVSYRKPARRRAKRKSGRQKA